MTKTITLKGKDAESFARLVHQYGDKYSEGEATAAPVEERKYVVAITSGIKGDMPISQPLQPYDALAYALLNVDYYQNKGVQSMVFVTPLPGERLDIHLVTATGEDIWIVVKEAK